MTFYTVSKLNVLCGPTDQKIALGKGWSYINLLLSTIGYAGGTYWLSVLDGYIPGRILAIGWPLYILAASFTLIFLHYDSCCCSSCCCDCCIGEEQVLIHDPSNPEAILVWRNKQVTLELCPRV